MIPSSLIFCESLLKQAATPFGIAPVTFDLTVPFTFSVLMWGIFYDNASKQNCGSHPSLIFFQTTRLHSFNMNSRSLNREVAKLQQLQLYRNTIVVRESQTVADWTTITTIWKPGFTKQCNLFPKLWWQCKHCFYLLYK